MSKVTAGGVKAGIQPRLPTPKPYSFRKQLAKVRPALWKTASQAWAWGPSNLWLSPSGAKVAICVREGRAVLAEVAVEG